MMIEKTSWYKLNSPNVVCDVVSDEVVLVDLETGAYYSTEKSGTTIWQLLNEGYNVAQIIESVAGKYLGDIEEIEKNVHDLVEQLLNEGLIVVGSAPETATQTNGLFNTEQTPKEPFRAVVLHKYVDMEDLLLLDPIHQVDEIGWPNAGDQRK